MVNNEKSNKPIVLAIAAHDPTGGAGIQADIESISANDCYPLSLITAMTQQTLTHGVTGIYPQDVKIFSTQLESIFEEFDIDAIKIGVIANTEQLDSIIRIIQPTGIPIVLDPVIQSTSGYHFYQTDFIESLINELIPLCSIITPNKQEFTALSAHIGCNNSEESFEKIHSQSILITSSKNTDDLLTHRLITNSKEYNFEYKKFGGEYHGSGCTLSSAIAARLAQKEPLDKAVKNALDYTWQTLNTASIKINNTYIPNRFFN